MPTLYSGEFLLEELLSEMLEPAGRLTLQNQTFPNRSNYGLGVCTTDIESAGPRWGQSGSLPGLSIRHAFLPG